MLSWPEIEASRGQIFEKLLMTLASFFKEELKKMAPSLSMLITKFHAKDPNFHTYSEEQNRDIVVRILNEFIVEAEDTYLFVKKPRQLNFPVEEQRIYLSCENDKLRYICQNPKKRKESINKIFTQEDLGLEVYKEFTDLINTDSLHNLSEEAKKKFLKCTEKRMDTKKNKSLSRWIEKLRSNPDLQKELKAKIFRAEAYKEIRKLA